MTRFDALRALLAKVEAGEFPVDTSAHELGWADIGDGLPALSTAYRAYAGSLDAAKALHEAVLPGWFWSVDAQGEAEVAIVNQSNGLWRVRHSFSDVVDDNPARSWLIAILKALIATEDN